MKTKIKLKQFRLKHYIKLTSLTLITFLTAAPVFYLMVGALSSASKSTIDLNNFISIELFISSILLNISAAIITVILGFLSAICIWVFFEKKALKIALLIILLFLLPQFIHVQSWIFFVDKINSLLADTFYLSYNFSGNFAIILTISFAYLPITTGISLIAFLSIPPAISDLCLIDSHGKSTFLKVYLPFLYPSFWVGGFLVFLLNINEYAIPSLFGVNVYALELFSRFSAGSDKYKVFLSSIPLILLCTVLIILFSLYISKSNFTLNSLHGKNPFKHEVFFRIPAIIGFIILMFFMLVPLISLTYEASRAYNSIDIILSSSNEILYSLGISSLTAILCFIPALLSAYYFYKSKYRFFVLSIASISFIIPSAIAGLSLIEMWNTPLLSNIYVSPFMPSIAMVSRFIFIEVIILFIAFSRLNSTLLDNLHLHYPGFIRGLWCIICLIKKECISCLLIVFALAMGEFSMTLLVTPPGYQSLTVKIYNYLHYGASETIAVLCVFILVFMLTITFAVYSLLVGEKNE